MSNHERGAGNFKAILTVVILGFGIFLGVKLLPPYVGNYELQQDLETIARMATYAQGKTVADIQNDVVAKAKEDNVEITAENVQVEKTGSGVNIDVKYSVTIQLPGKALVLPFNPTPGNKLLTAK